MDALMMKSAIILSFLYHIACVTGTFTTKTQVEAKSKPTDSDFEDRFLALVGRVEELESRDLLQQGRLEELESRDRIQQAEIDSLKTELRLQKQRSGVLEKLLRRWKTSKTRGDVPQEVSTSEQDMPSGGNKADMKDNTPAPRIRRAENDQAVAFYATLSTHTRHAGINQNVVFDHVVTNVGNAYSNSLGAFVAPVSGIYVFAVNLMTYAQETEHFQLSKNGNMVSMLYARANEAPDNTVALTAVLQLAKGDNVEIRFTDADGSAFGAHYSSFAGFLLQQDITTTASAVGK